MLLDLAASPGLSERPDLVGKGQKFMEAPPVTLDCETGRA